MVKSGKGARIGVISDTHGYLDPQVLEEFAGVDHIIHAGDIMDASTLEALGKIAPVTAVAGNMDDGKLGKLPREVTGKVGGIRFVVGHKHKRLMKRLTLGKIDGLGKHDIAGPRRLRSRPPARGRVGGRHAVPQSGVGERAALRGRRPDHRDRRVGSGRARRALRAHPAARGRRELRRA